MCPVPVRYTIQNVAFVALVVVITILAGLLLLPYYGAILWAVILAILFNPLQEWLVVRLGGRSRLAATLSVLVCIVVVLVPATLITATLSFEIRDAVRWVRSENFSLAQVWSQVQQVMPAQLRGVLAAWDLETPEQVEESLLAGLAGIGTTLATGALGVGQSTIQFLISVAVMLYLLYFLFRDGPTLRPMLRNSIPLEPSRAEHIISKFVSVAKATVRGNILIAVVQGAIGAITFWLLGISSPILWGVVMAALSLLPAVGAFLVWAPFAAYLLLSGDYARGITLLVVGALIISMIDNLLRPILVGRETKMPDYVVLLSTLGGLSLFGANGFILGPVVAALFISVWSLFTKDRLRVSHSSPT